MKELNIKKLLLKIKNMKLNNSIKKLIHSKRIYFMKNKINKLHTKLNNLLNLLLINNKLKNHKHYKNQKNKYNIKHKQY